MKTIRSEYMRKHIMKKVYKVVFSIMLTFTLVFIIPSGFHKVYAALLEDCDLDGYDDATGVPVPWPGYDETKGDTPEGPGGVKTPTIAPSSTNSTVTGNTDSTSTGTAGSTSTRNTDNASTGTAGSTSTGNTGSTSTGNAGSTSTGTAGSASTGNTGNTSTRNAGSTSTGNASNTSTGKAGSTSTGNTGSASAGNAGSTSTGNTGKALNGNKGGTSTGNASGTANGNADGTTTGNTGSATLDNKYSANSDNASSVSTDNSGSEMIDSTKGLTSDVVDSTVPSTTSNQDEVAQDESEQVVANSSIGNTGNVNLSVEEIESIVNTKGSLEITETTGSIIHAGSVVIISGSGFIGNINNLEIEIQSEPRQLGSVASIENGTFETQVTIPEDLEAGTHHIVVLYQGNEITRLQLEVGPKAANGFLQALSVGFTKDNKGLIPGLLILGGLLVLGVITLTVNALIHTRGAKTKQENCLS